MLIFLKLWELGKKYGMSFIDFDICQQLKPLQNLQLMTSTYFFKVKNLKFSYIGNSES